ncbi:unnamed protein product [Chondrus crispus]|uniref:mRNA guanylyltransferase n=1 Tax=Chondrus crispus TaxID=2769 RepID=R7QGF4_CHOCR|nr:unnamed protein product [Chondrus crispus]CDF36521.1 unnamed protein product [Chondrus crispus]|eukprot:XP_005716340.1 unnamed protein product [Chondrus crispus]
MSKGFASPQDNTCLDGELTYNIMTQQWEYLIYDAIAVDGDLNVAQTGFRQRMQAAEVFIAGPRCWAPFCSGLLRLRIKDYYEKRNIRKLFANIRRDPKGHYLYINNDRRDGVICNENDGVILSPVGMPYQVRNCPALLKWKPPHLNSIDFTLQLEKTLDPRHNQPSVKCHIAYKGERSIVRMREIYFPSKLRRQFAANFDKFNNSIVELAYDRMAGEWKYIRQREDKAIPNFSTTVIDTMETIAENMERGELVVHLEKTSRSPPQSELELIQAVAKNVEVCTYRNDLFDDENHDYLVATPISLVRPPQITPQPRRLGGNRRPNEGRRPRPHMPNGNPPAAGSAEGRAGRDAFEYSDDV